VCKTGPVSAWRRQAQPERLNGPGFTTDGFIGDGAMQLS
jgi:hypothetical protein